MRSLTMRMLAAGWLCGAVMAGPAEAQDQGPPASEADRRSGMAGGQAADRNPSAAADWDATLRHAWAGEFERGYRAGLVDERARGAEDRFRIGLAWNDTHQSEAFEHLERAAAELRRALVLIGRQPTLPRVQGALVQAREALIRTQNALTWLPALPDRNAEPPYPRVRGVGPERASGGWEG